MSHKRPSKELSFWGVAASIIIFGSAILALGLVEWIFDMSGIAGFGYPMGKVLIGVVILALGYIVLELELMRHDK